MCLSFKVGGLKILTVILIIVHSALGFYENQPKFISENGHLVIESAQNRNISFRMKGRGYVNVNDVNILNSFQATSNRINPSPSMFSFDRLTRRVHNLEVRINGENGVINRLSYLENGTNQYDYAPNRNNVRQINMRVQRLEEKVDITIRKLTEDNCRSFPCQNGGTCISRYEGFICLCPKNWEGGTCGVDVNECAHFAGTDLGCQNEAACQNTQGSYNCLCKAGWQGLHCTRQTADCLSGNSGDLCGHGTCVQSNSAVGYTCICDQGWKTNGVTPACTVDIDECLDSKPHCSKEPEVTCVNLPGSFMCGHCPPGFSGNGFYCTDINECDSNNGGCSKSPLVPCINSRGSFRCGRCPSGYSGDGNTCIRSGSSCTNQEFCHPQARCIQYGNSVPLCECPAGYTGDGYGPNGCTRTNSCTPNPCLNGGVCVANGTSWSCNCPPRTVGTNCARRMDRCNPNPCQNGGTCTQTQFTRRCACPNGYLGIYCQTQQRTCGGRLNSPSGTLKYPVDGVSTYQHNAKCAWLINTNITQVLNVTFTQFHLEQSTDCRFDWLQIHDGRSTAYHMLGRFCGNTLPKGGNIISTHNLLYLWFRSDNSTSHSGFTLNWNSIDPICGGEIETTTFGTISSPGSPGNYPQNRDCSWHLSSPPGKRIQMHFYTMKLEIHDSCDFDYLAIYDGSSDQGTLLEKYCNTSLPEPLLSTGNEVTMQFHSDGYSSDTGFQIHYSIVEGIPGCGGTFTSVAGEFGSPIENGRYQHNLICEYLIKMPVNVRIFIEFREFHIEDHSSCRFDHVAIYEGKTDQDRLVNKYCGDQTPPSYTSESNILLIQFKSDFSTSYAGFRIRYTNVCGGTFTDNPGIISSPNYPRSYDIDRTCTYIIEAPIGNAILLDFIDIDIERSSNLNCSFDYIEAFDGIKSNLSSLGKYCGEQIPERIISTTNYLHLEFTTDSSISGRGFKANYTFIESKCGGILKTTDTLIKPPSNIEGEYDEQSYCTWVIVAPPEKVIQLTWTSFDIEGSSTCNYDYVEIYDNSTSYGGLIGRFCGQNHPPTLTSTDNIITIIFKSDLLRSDGGFSASIVFIDATNLCGGRFYSTTGVLHSPGFPQNYLHSKNCEWIISVPSGQQIELISKSFEIESHRECRYDYLEIRNGGTSNSPLLGKFCGDTIPERLTSFSNQMYLKFVSDNSLSAKGFEFEWDGTATGCGGTLTSHRGTITSPNYPDPYGENTICIWKINVNLGSNIQIIISDLEMESSGGCTLDYLEIFDGRDSSAHSFGRFCTDNHPLHIESTENKMYLKMQSDRSDQGRGFNLKYMAGCKRNITGHMGIIESPNFPENYPEMLSCEWTLQATKGNKIFIEFSHFNIENSNIYNDIGEHTCSFDYLEVKQLEDSNEISSIKYCNQPPTNFTSMHDVVVIKFVSDNSGTASGFRLEWRIEGCGDIIRRPFGTLSSPNYPKPYPENTHCEWTIIAQYGFSVELTINDFEFETSDNCHFDGLFVSNSKNNTQVLAMLCHKTNNPMVILGSGNEMFLKFYSDVSVGGKGFSASYRFVPSKCGSRLTIPKGFIYSPNYPSNYDGNSVCEWLISIDKNHLIELYIMDFDIETSENCKDDKFMIYDGPEKIEDRQLLTHCGNRLPNISKFVSSDNEMLITFSSDDTIAAKGFKLNYTIACGARIITNDSGVLTLSENVKTHLTNCTWILESSKPTQHITLTITHLDLIKDEEESDKDELNCLGALEIYDGDSSESPSKGVFCGIKHPIPIVSTGQFLTVHLATMFPYGSVLSAVHFTAHYSIYDNACGGIFTSEHGLFASPNYPSSYPLNVECVWNIVASPGNKMGVSFQTFDITASDNCHDSYLEIRENDESGRLIGIYCGQNIPYNLTSSNGFWVKFRSGEVIGANGFLADYFYKTNNEITGRSGQIASPLYPNNLFTRNGEYTWRISTLFGSLITVTFKDIMIYTNFYCEFKIFDGYDETAPTLADLCDTDFPEPVKSSSNVLYFKLLQNRTPVGTRFLVNWEAVDKIPLEKNETNSICGNKTIILNELGEIINFTSPGYPYGYEKNINCSWIIMSNSTNNHPVIEMRDIDLEETNKCVADYIDIFESEDLSTWKLLARRCNNDKDVENTFHGNPYLRIDFQSDSYGNKTGFRGLLNLKCGSPLKGPTGVISVIANNNTNIRDTLVKNQCFWNITVRQGRTIKFTFESFVLPTSEDRCSSYIILRNGIDEDSPFLGIGKYCGLTILEINETSSNKALVKFKYNYDPQSNFVLRYQEVSQECGGNFILNKNVNSTIITSPNYPNVPFAHSECIWTIMAPSGETLKFDFIDTFDLRQSPSCQWEYVEIRDGSTYGSQIIGRYCGTKPLPDTTSNNVMQIKFFTDVAEPNNGFKIKVSIALCGSVYRSHTGIIMSPNYPNSYPSNLNCEYHIFGKPGTFLNLTFITIDMPNGNCNNSDKIEIYSIENDENRNVTEISLGSFCGISIPQPIIANGNEVKLRFKTFQNQNKQGFKISYNSSAQECDSEITAETGVITSPGYPNAKLSRRVCVWKIHVPKGRRIRIDFDDFDLNFRAQYIGFFNEIKENNRIVYFKGGDNVFPIYSSDNKMEIKLWIRTNSNHRGFKLRYSSNESTICEGDFNNQDGLIISPSNVTNFACEYARNPTPFFEQVNIGTLAMDFTDMTIGNKSNNICNYVTTKISVWFGGSPDPSNTLAMLCSNTTKSANILSPFVDTKVYAIQGLYRGNLSFNLAYKVHKCGGLIYSQSEVSISKPNFTENYGKVDCAWQIKFDEGLVSITFRTMRLKLSCDKEYINIYNGPTPKSPKMGKFCETSLPLVLTSHSHVLFVEYHADSYSSDSTFNFNLNPSSTACGGILTHPHYSFKSPTVNSKYPNNIECFWEIQSFVGYNIGLQFTGRFFIEQSNNCTKDYIEIFEKTNDKWSSFGRVCGRETPRIFNSTGTHMKVLFRSDDAIAGEGFNATWNENCGGTFNATTDIQLISSPGYPEPYGKSMICNYTIYPSDNKYLNLKFLDFEIENSFNDCNFDNLTIYKRRHYHPFDLQLQGTYCREKPEDLRSNEQINIIFMTDNWVERKGFQFEFFLDNCGGVITESTVINSPKHYGKDEYPSHLKCYWNISAPAGKKISIRFEKIDLEHSGRCYYDYIEIFSGSDPSVNSNRLAKLCGNLTDPPNIIVDDNNAVLHLHTDSSNNIGGFSALVIFSEMCNRKFELTDLNPIVNINEIHFAYAPFLDCHYLVTSPVNRLINITFDQFHIAACEITHNTSGCVCDFVEIRDGSGPASDLIGTYCGHTLPKSIATSGSALWIRFATDATINSAGFSATIRLHESECGPLIINMTTNDTNTIQSPGVDKYLPNLKCIWTLIAEEGKKIELDFEKLDLQEVGDYGDCSNDMLEISDDNVKQFVQEGLGSDFIYSGKSRTGDTASFYSGIRNAIMHNQYCGNGIPQPYISSNNKVYVKFQTDSDVELSGFKILARVVQNCGRNYSSTQGRIVTNHADECSFWITAPNNYTISLYFLSFGFSETSCETNGIKIYENGPEGKLINTLCGYSQPDPIFTTTNSIYIRVLKEAVTYGHYDFYYLASNQGPGCGGQLFNYGGIFTSPQYPQNDRNYSDCRWDISVPQNLKVALKFTTFDFGIDKSCESNFVEIIEIAENTEVQTVVRKYCGDDLPAAYRGNRNILSVRFKKTVNFAGTGFLAQFIGIHSDTTLYDW